MHASYLFLGKVVPLKYLALIKLLLFARQGAEKVPYPIILLTLSTKVLVLCSSFTCRIWGSQWSRNLARVRFGKL
jgi:hypothetical protein